MDNLKETISQRYKLLQDSLDNQYHHEKVKIKQQTEINHEDRKRKTSMFNNFTTSFSPQQQSYEYPIENTESRNKNAKT